MPIDPVSVVGYVSTAASLISFLANTVSRLEKLKRDYTESAKLLAWYREKFDTCNTALYVWHSTYCGLTRTWTEKQFVDIWGAEDFASVQSRLLGITSEINYVVTLLYSGSGLDLDPSSGDSRLPTAKDRQSWETRFQHWKSDTKTTNFQYGRKSVMPSTEMQIL